MRIRSVLWGLMACVLVAPLGVLPSQAAPAELLGEVSAMARAKAVGVPVEVTALTDEWTKVVADPVSGTFRAEFTAGVARVRDGQGGWRDADSTLVVGADGVLHPVASRLPIAISNGGGEDLVSLGVADQRVGLRWGGPLPVPVVTGDTAVYGSVLPGVDLVAQATPDTVSTFLVVKDRAAAMNPAVRRVRFGVTGDGIAGVRAEQAGGATFMGRDGAQGVTVSALAMWDSQGKEHGAPVADRLSPTAQAREAAMQAHVGVNELVVVPDVAMLDDPETVYPVVIDPTLSGGSTFAWRVTNGWSRATRAGDDARVGYNGWTSPYYESELYYQFDMGGMAPSNIVNATFSHDNDHSVQHSPCYAVGWGHPIQVGVTGAVSSSTTWSTRPGWHANPVGNANAVGHDSYCVGGMWTLNWDLGAQLRALTQPVWTLTVGMRGEARGDKMNWREFYNVFGAGSQSRPLLAVEYVLPTQPVQSVRLAGTDVLGLSPSYAYTGSVRPAFEATLPTSASCRTADPCLRARFEVLNEAYSQVLHTMYSPKASTGAVVSAQVPVELAHDTAYWVRAIVENTDYGRESSVKWMDLPVRTWTRSPVAPTALPAMGQVVSGRSWSTTLSTTSELVTRFCLQETTITDQSQLANCTATADRSAVVTTQPLVTSSRSEQKRFFGWVCYQTGECAHTGELVVTVTS